MKDKIVLNNLQYTVTRVIMDEKYGQIIKCVRFDKGGFEKIYIMRNNNHMEKVVDINLNKYLNDKYDFITEEDVN